MGEGAKSGSTSVKQKGRALVNSRTGVAPKTTEDGLPSYGAQHRLMATVRVWSWRWFMDGMHFLWIGRWHYPKVAVD